VAATSTTDKTTDRIRIIRLSLGSVQQPPAETAPVELAELLVADIPLQGATETPGTGIVWLSPGMPRSVAPSGMPEPEPDPTMAAFVSAAVEVVPIALPVLAELHAVDVDMPPPSNDVLALVLGHGVVSGLMPVWLSSVAPNGMLPIAGAGSESVVPKGEVAPMPGCRLVCASAE
jgi:hypothetical protein